MIPWILPSTDLVDIFAEIQLTTIYLALSTILAPRHGSVSPPDTEGTHIKCVVHLQV